MQTIRARRVIKAGNTLAVTIPRNICRELKINRGDIVTIGVQDESHFVVRVLREPELQLMLPRIEI